MVRSLGLRWPKPWFSATKFSPPFSEHQGIETNPGAENLKSRKDTTGKSKRLIVLSANRRDLNLFLRSLKKGVIA